MIVQGHCKTLRRIIMGYVVSVQSVQSEVRVGVRSRVKVRVIDRDVAGLGQGSR